ncbi:hypothetical protein IM25_21485 [Rhodococcus sp. p52]|uniref:hypothetical protein n=1 Tax=Rhodococcus sp. p52 TaxID=935199 RepID=UPI00051A4D92|nr:hypothetical protein [Rhodococcus sp. p52]AOD23836.1 hypothetical protein IM25_21485 [Rhodococcus sp. p52]
MSEISSAVRNLAAIAAAKQLLAKAEAAAKAELSAELKRGTVYAHTAAGEELGYATVPKPSKPKPSIEVVNEAELFAWMVDQFGDEVIETKVQLTEQGLRLLWTHVESAVALAEPFDATLPPGVEVSIPPAKVPTPRFTPAKNVVELVQGMYFRGELNLSDVLALEGGDRDD